ncbi:DUF4926 domain-containing protein [Mycobacterium sp. NPDC050551]|uniref:DUF4926 domain-containing protein n=1 Tax=Mycobacterium sp. NPDC050551 TaxID=3155407 RepID=UPI00344A3E01
MTPKEYDVVRLRRALPEHGVEAGREGTVVIDHGRGPSGAPAFEVEFCDGLESVVVTLVADDVDVVWRQMSDDEMAVMTAVVAAQPSFSGLLDGLAGAFVRHSTDWILDIRTPGDSPSADVPDGPLPVRAFVPNADEYRGEILIWVQGGRLSGLEYAWVTDEVPSRWPRPDEIEVISC